MDAVLLSAWAKVPEDARVLDLCSGNGIIPILMDARLPEEIRRKGQVRFTGVEINAVSVDLARRSAMMNGQSERICFLEGDIRDVCRTEQAHSGTGRGGGITGREITEDGTGGPEAGTFSCVTVNPPYMTPSGGLKGPSADRAAARHELLCTIDDVAMAAARALKPGGHLYMVHRPHRLGDIIPALERQKLAVKRMRMVHPFAEKAANLVLIDAAQGGRAYVRVESPLIVYRETGVYTEELKALYG